MGALNGASVPAPVLPKETVEVPALNGEVIVCGLKLTDRLAMQQRMARRRGAEDEGAVYDMVPELLALAVVGADGAAIFTREQWQVFGASHQAEALAVFTVAMRLSGFSGGGDPSDAEADPKN